MLVLPPRDIPGNAHHLSPTSKTHVTRADTYRLSWAGVIERNQRFGALTDIFQEAHRPTDSFGVAGLESQEHSVLWIGPSDLIAQIESNPAAPIPFAELNSRGSYADRWPNTAAWLNFIPATTWNPDGQGIVAEYPFSDGDGSVIVYELLGHPALGPTGGRTVPDGLAPLVTFHCTRCHREGDSHDRYTSAGPDDRRTVCRKARSHMQPGQCRGAEAVAWENNMIATVERVVAGTSEPADVTGLAASRCQTRELRLDDVMARSSCAEIREARKHTARHRTT